MLKEVKYYNRAYNMIEELREVYRNGFDPNSTYNYWEDQNNKYNNNSVLALERINSLKLTVMIALFGLNKESIEKTEKYLDYDEFVLEFDFRNVLIPNILQGLEYNDGIRRFETYRNQNTVFDNWLSIHVPVPSDNTNKDIFRRVRNGLLHSNFDLEMDSLGRSFSHIKTKNYYESIILNPNFEQFVKGYFGNCGPFGLVENDIIIDFPFIGYNNESELRKSLDETQIIKINYTMDKYNGLNYFGKYFDGSKPIDSDYFKRVIKRMNNNGMNVNDIYSFSLSEEAKSRVIQQIMRFYPDIYNYESFDQISIIKGAIQAVLDIKTEISNWLMHFDHIAQEITKDSFNVNDIYISTERFVRETCEASLAVLKAYLIMYRMQYIKKNPTDTKKFEELNYDLINIPTQEQDYYLEVTNPNDSTFTYQTLVDRKLQSNPIMNMDEINKRIICEIIRDGLAHGNIYPYYEENQGKDAIYIEDINPRNPDEKKTLQMTLESFNRFLDSEAFKPKYCYNRNRTLH